MDNSIFESIISNYEVNISSDFHSVCKPPQLSHFSPCVGLIWLVIQFSLPFFSSMSSRLVSILAPYLTLYLPDVTFKQLPFIVFGLGTLLAAIVSVFLPESLGHPLPYQELQQQQSKNWLSEMVAGKIERGWKRHVKKSWAICSILQEVVN